MLELTGVASILRGISILYWLVAASVVAVVLWRVKPLLRKILWALVAIAVFGFMPVEGYIAAKKRENYAREAWAYFKKLCAEKSGEKIYKTFTGVKSVLVIKPLPPATEKDLYDQYWYGDPYSMSATSDRGKSAATRLIYDRKVPSLPGGIQKGLEFVEIKYEEKDGTRFMRVAPTSEFPHERVTLIQKPVSQFGVSWEDISTPENRNFWVAASRLRIIDLTDGSLVAERIGFFIEAGFGATTGARRPWLASRGPTTTCPYAHDYSDQMFILTALRPSEEKQYDK